MSGDADPGPRWPIPPAMQQTWMACADSQGPPRGVDDDALVAPASPDPDPPRIELPSNVLEAMGPLPVTIEVTGTPAAMGCRDPKSVSPLQSLAGGEQAPVLCCSPRIRRSSFLASVWLDLPPAAAAEAGRCRFQLFKTQAVVEATNVDELATALAPIDDPAQALGAIALFYPDLYLPIFHDQRVEHRQRSQEHDWITFPDRPAVEVEARDWGFVVRAPEWSFRRCGRHHLLRRAFAVSTDGRVCRFNEDPLPLAYAREERCPEVVRVSSAH